MTEQTGRNSTPVEVILRMLAVKRLYGLSYERTEYQVRDSLVLRQFCRVYFNEVPDDTTLIRWAGLIQPETLERFNHRLTQLARQLKVTKGRKLRTDGTVVETNIHHPSDSSLLADSVRVLGRTLRRAQRKSCMKRRQTWASKSSAIASAVCVVWPVRLEKPCASVERLLRSKACRPIASWSRPPSRQLSKLSKFCLPCRRRQTRSRKTERNPGNLYPASRASGVSGGAASVPGRKSACQ
jgi:hypothetical protein